MTLQNQTLHEQLDTLVKRTEKLKEINDLQESAKSSLGGGESLVDTGKSLILEQTQTSESQLRRLTKYLQREKELLEAEMEVVKSKNARFKHRSELLERSLDELKQKLLNNANDDGGFGQENLSNDLRSKLKTAESQLQLLGESNMYLKRTSAESQVQLVEAEQKLKILDSELEPLKERLRNVNAEKDASVAEKQALEEEKEMWRQRVERMVKKYHQIDPTMHEKKMKELEECY